MRKVLSPSDIFPIFPHVSEALTVDRWEHLKTAAEASNLTHKTDYKNKGGALSGGGRGVREVGVELLFNLLSLSYISKGKSLNDSYDFN